MGIAGNMSNILQSSTPGNPGGAATPATEPGAYAIPTVQTYVGAHPEDALATLTAELAARNRVSLVAWLRARFATGATAGIPGAWTAAAKTAPATVADLVAGYPNTIVASPATLWTVGQFVQTLTAGAPGQAYWSGVAWTAGVGPA